MRGERKRERGLHVCVHMIVEIMDEEIMKGGNVVEG